MVDSGPTILSSKPRLQHLGLKYCSIVTGSAGIEPLLCEMQRLQQLTYLGLRHSLGNQQAMAPASAYSALTASSKLQRLDISECILPPEVWEYVFPAGSRSPLLPHLRSLTISSTHHPDGPAVTPEGSHLVSCCPGLQSLDVQDLQYSAGLLGPLEGLGSLRVSV